MTYFMLHKVNCVLNKTILEAYRFVFMITAIHISALLKAVINSYFCTDTFDIN